MVLMASHWRRLTFVLVTTILLALASASPAAAHSQLQSTEPANVQQLAESPEQIVLRFAEPVEASLGAINLYD